MRFIGRRTGMMRLLGFCLAAPFVDDRKRDQHASGAEHQQSQKRVNEEGYQEIQGRPRDVEQCGRGRPRKRLTQQIELAHRLRSEEHTSELQSLMRISYAVFCFKKQNTKCSRHVLYCFNTLYKNDT